MAKLPALVTELAKVDGRDRPTVDHIARIIREAGYIPTGKRGNGAEEMTSREAVNLLIALNGADTPKDGPLAIDRFRSLRQWAVIGRGSPATEQLERYDSYPQAIQDVMNARTFGEALEGLIQGTHDLVLALLAYAVGAYGKERGFKMFWAGLKTGLYGVEITFARYSGKIEMFTMNGSERRVEFEANYMADADRATEGFYGNFTGDRRVVSTIGTPTLMAAWAALNPGSEIAGIADNSA